MIERLFSALGIDYPIWNALTMAWLRMSFRSTAASGMAVRQAAKNRGVLLFNNGLMYLMAGLMLSVAALASANPITAATIVTGYVMVLVGSMVMLDHAAVLTSPSDHAMLGWRPITSRTYFAARVSVILVYTLVFAAIAGIGPLFVFLIGRGFASGMSMLAAILAAACFSTLTIAFGYAWLLRAVGANRLRRVLTYVQLVASFVSFGGYMLPSLLNSSSSLHFALPASNWLLAVPPVWFGSYVAIATHTAGAREVAGALLSIAGFLALGLTIGRRVSLDYAERLGGVFASASSVRKKRGRRPWFLQHGEARAMNLLIRAQFRHDQAFRLQVLTFIPLGAVYLLMALREGPLPDPFDPITMESMGWAFIAADVTMLSVLFAGTLPRSDSYKASWIYFVAPVERMRVLQATKKVFIVRLLLPAIAAVTLFISAVFGHLVHNVVHFGILTLITLFLMQVMHCLQPELPFSLEKAHVGQNVGTITVVIMIAVFGSLAVGPILSWLIYPSAIRIGVLVLILIAGNIALDRLTRFRVERLAAGLEFAG